MSKNIMARLVSVCRSDDYPFERRQIPLEVDDSLTMVIQFNDSCAGCDQGGVKQAELERFVQKFRALSNDEIAVALMVTNREIMHLLSQMVPCVGCRRSVERLFKQLVNAGHPALEPLIVTRGSSLSIKRDHLFDPKAIYALFYIHGSKLTTMMETIPKSKKNKRCSLHSLDSHTHKTKSLGSWMDIWDLLSQECREEVVLIDCDSLVDTLENYLRKHRFCSECKSKVLRAYNILVGEVDSSKEKGYCPNLYEGLRCCPGERHLHVLCDTDFIAHLIGRAEPELTGSRRERHAKTLDVAQEEVLTCLGLHLYERLHKIWQKLRAEEQTWQILFYLGVDALRKNFEVELEKKQGKSNLELVYQEFLEEEQAKELKREQKRQKKKKKKNKTKPDPDIDQGKDKENCKCDEDTSTQCASCDDTHADFVTIQTCSCDSPNLQESQDSGGTSKYSDPGYSSGQEGCESCSIPSSQDGSDIACSEGICNHDGDSPLCNRNELPLLCSDCGLSPLSSKNHSPVHKSRSSKCDGSQSVDLGAAGGEPAKKYQTTLSLQDMLEASCSSGEEADGISEEEIRSFKANQSKLDSQRQELRETLRQRFANMQQRAGCVCCPNKHASKKQAKK